MPDCAFGLAVRTLRFPAWRRFAWRCHLSPIIESPSSKDLGHPTPPSPTLRLRRRTGHPRRSGDLGHPTEGEGIFACPRLRLGHGTQIGYRTRRGLKPAPRRTKTESHLHRRHSVQKVRGGFCSGVEIVEGEPLVGAVGVAVGAAEAQHERIGAEHFLEEGKDR